jgi:hypothetical protein
VYHPALGSYALDVQIVDSLTPARQEEAAAAPSAVSVTASSTARIPPLEKAARRKRTKNEEAAASCGFTFLPFIIDVSGALHADAANLMEWIGANARVRPDVLSWQTPSMRAYWLQRLGTVLQTANAGMALACLQGSAAC